MREELKQILSKFEKIERQIEELLALLPEQGRLFGSEQQKAQSKLANLKDSLEREAHRRDFSQAEECWYSHAIRQALCHIHVKRNSIPDRRWIEQLYIAKTDISFASHDLRTHLLMT